MVNTIVNKPNKYFSKFQNLSSLNLKKKCMQNSNFFIFTIFFLLVLENNRIV